MKPKYFEIKDPDNYLGKELSTLSVSDLHKMADWLEDAADEAFNLHEELEDLRIQVWRVIWIKE